MTQEQSQDLTYAYFEHDVGYARRASFFEGYYLAYFKTQIEAFWLKHPLQHINIDEHRITVNCLSREALADFLLAFGGNWKKEPEEYFPDKMKYTQELPCPFNVTKNPIVIMAGMVPPPPSCRIEEYEVEEPARKVMKKRIVCKDNGDVPPSELESPTPPITEEAVLGGSTHEPEVQS